MTMILLFYVLGKFPIKIFSTRIQINNSNKFRPLSKKTFDEAQQIYEEFVSSGNLPDGIHTVNTKDSYPILEYTIVSENFKFYIFDKVSIN